MNFNEWLDTLPGAPTPSQAADRAEVSRATVLRHSKAGATTMEYVVKIARTFNVNEIQALIDMGFVNEAAVMELAIEDALDQAKNSQLLATMGKRVDPESRRVFNGEGQPGVIGIKRGSQLYPVPAVEQDEDQKPERYVAKRKRPEPAEGDDDYGSGA